MKFTPKRREVRQENNRCSISRGKNRIPPILLYINEWASLLSATFMKKWFWIAFGILALFSFSLFGFGFALAIHEVVNPPSTPLTKASSEEESSPAPEQGGMLLSLGDSLTRGTGDINGVGYVGVLREELRKKYGPDTQVVNLGINGQTSDDLLQQVKQPKVQKFLQEARWITITIGSNDLNRKSGGIFKIDKKGAQQGKKQYEKNLNQIFQLIREQNPEAPIFIFGLYNPFADLQNESETTPLIREWNQTLQEVAGGFPHVIVVPTFDLFQLNTTAYLYTDHFHPNQEGYRRMAERLLQLLQDYEQGKEKNR